MKGATDVGRVRETNQDSFFLGRDGNWCMIADGMGGHNGGETASRMAVKAIRKVMDNARGDLSDRLCEAIQAANEAVYQKARSTPLLSGMGTTVVLASFDDDQAIIAHVGDSRAYHISPDHIRQLTTDHSIVQQLMERGSITAEEAKHHPQKNFITRAVGTDAQVDVDVNHITWDAGEYLLLCSDGLTTMIGNEAVHRVVLERGVEQAPAELIRLANESGGMDNITVVLAQKEGGVQS